MQSNWNTTTLDQLGRIVTGKTPSTKVEENFGDEYPFVSPRDMNGSRFIGDTERLLSEQGAQSVKSSIVPENSVVVSCIGSDMGKAAILQRRSVTNQQINSLIVNSEHDYRFIYYNLSARKDEIRSMAGGSAQPILNKSDFGKLSIALPERAEQSSIADILSSLDDKIELNRQMNETLEAMAQALFKSWFVDFDPVIDNAVAAGNEIPEPLQARAAARQALGDQRKPLPPEIQAQFPSRFVFTDEMGWIPEEWKVAEVGSIVERLTIRKRYKKKDVEEFGSVPVYEQGANILLGYHENEAEIDATLADPAFIFGDHTCVTKLSIKPFSISENVIALKGKGLNTSWVYYAVSDKQHFEEYRRHWMELIVKNVVVPPEGLTELFGLKVQSLLEKQQIASDENSTLSRLRDTLLPKLLSGQLRVDDAEKQVTETS